MAVDNSAVLNWLICPTYRDYNSHLLTAPGNKQLALTCLLQVRCSRLLGKHYSVCLFDLQVVTDPDVMRQTYQNTTSHLPSACGALMRVSSWLTPHVNHLNRCIDTV